MKIDDPKLTAFALGELSAEESREVQQAIEKDPTLAKEVSEIEAMAKLIEESYSGQQMSLSSSQRAQIFESGKLEQKITDISSAKPRSQWLPISLAATGIAAAVALTLTVVNQAGPASSAEVNYAAMSNDALQARFSAPSTPWSEEWNESEKPSTKSTKNAQPTLSDAARHEALKLRAAQTARAESTSPDTLADTDSVNTLWTSTKDKNSSYLPLVSGASSWQWVKNALTNKQQLSPQSIRTEELINHFQLPFSNDFEVNNIAANLQLLQSPWNTETVLAVVQLKNSGNSPVSQVRAGVEFSKNVESFRLIGYSDQTTSQSPQSINFPAGYAHTAIYELKLPASADSREVVTLHLTAGKQHRALSYSYLDQTLNDASLDAKLPVMVAYWAQWQNSQRKDHKQQVPLLINALANTTSLLKAAKHDNQAADLKILLDSVAVEK